MSICRVGSAEDEAELCRHCRRWRSFAMMWVISGSLVTSKYLNWSVIVSGREVFLAKFESVLAVVIILRLLGPFPAYLYPNRRQKHVLDVSIVREHPVHGRWHVLSWI